jgi:hypothetical protein
MKSSVYVVILAQMFLCIIQMALGPLLLVHVGFRQLDKLHSISTAAQQFKFAKKARKRNGGKLAGMRVAKPPDDSLVRLFLSLLATIPHGIFVVSSFCSLYIQRPYVFDFHDWLYYSCMEIFILIFILYFFPAYLLPVLMEFDNENKQGQNNSSTRRKNIRKKKNDDKVLTNVKNSICTKKRVNQRRRRRRRTFEFVTPVEIASHNVDIAPKLVRSDDLKDKATLKKRKGIRRSKKKQLSRAAHVKIDIDLEKVIEIDNEYLPPLPPPLAKCKTCKSSAVLESNETYNDSNGDNTIEIVFSRQIEEEAQGGIKFYLN